MVKFHYRKEEKMGMLTTMDIRFTPRACVHNRARPILVNPFFLTEPDFITYNLANIDIHFYQRISSRYRFFQIKVYQTDTDTDF